MKSYLTSIIPMIFLPLLMYGQPATTHEPVLWLTATENLHWNPQWSSGLNFQDRIFTETSQDYQLVFNLNTYYKINSTKLGVGYIYFTFHRNEIVAPESRPYQSILHSKQIGKWKINLRLNVEERFQYKILNNELTKDFDFSFRFRFKFEAVYKLWENDKENSMLLWLSTEPMIHAGDHIQHNVFDQNRLVVMYSYKPNNNWSFNTGYMNWLFQGPYTTDFNMRHVLILGISHKLYLRRDKTEETCYPGINCY